MEKLNGIRSLYLVISFFNQDNTDEIVVQFHLPLLVEHEKALMGGDVERCIQFTYPAKHHLINNIRRCYRSVYHNIPLHITSILVRIVLLYEGDEFSNYEISIPARISPSYLALLMNNLIGLNNDYFEIVKRNYEERNSRRAELDDDFVIMIRKDVLKSVIRHGRLEHYHETGGVLLGKVLHSTNSVNVVVTGFIRGKYMEHEIATLGFTPRTWAYFWRVIDGNTTYSNDQDWKIIGWYHTHPSYGIFLSNKDLSLHRNYFSQSYHLALVIDPLDSLYGFFNWEKSQRSIIQTPSRCIRILDDEGLLCQIDGDELSLPEIKLSS